MKFLLLTCFLIFVSSIYSIPHHDHDGHKHQDQDHKLGGSHTSGHSHHHHPVNANHNHNETKTQHLNHEICHNSPKIADCDSMNKGKIIFKHMNDTHHECSVLEDNKCSISSNSFETLEACEKICHHDDHH